MNFSLDFFGDFSGFVRIFERIFQDFSGFFWDFSGFLKNISGFSGFFKLKENCNKLATLGTRINRPVCDNRIRMIETFRRDSSG